MKLCTQRSELVNSLGETSSDVADDSVGDTVLEPSNVGELCERTEWPAVSTRFRMGLEVFSGQSMTSSTRQHEHRYRMSYTLVVWITETTDVHGGIRTAAVRSI